MSMRCDVLVRCAQSVIEGFVRRVSLGLHVLVNLLSRLYLFIELSELKGIRCGYKAKYCSMVSYLMDKASPKKREKTGCFKYLLN